jgi:protein TonB
MVAAFAFNLSILLCFVMVPLIYLEALTPQTIITLIPLAPVLEQQPVQKPIAQTPRPVNNVPVDPFTAPRRIPTGPIYIPPEPEVAFSNPGGDGLGIPGVWGPSLPGQPTPRAVHLEAPIKVRVSTAVEEGLILQKTRPVYPPIAIAAHVQGTVILAANISKGGAIENLRVVSGPAMLQQSAVNAVGTWRYRPYLLDGQPVEVETTVNVVFTLGR